MNRTETKKEREVVTEVKSKDFPEEDVVYEEPEFTGRRRARFFKCSRTMTGKSYLVRGTLQDTDVEMKFLLDTGASMNIVPLDQFLRIPEKHRPRLEKPPHNIEVGDGREMEVRGIAQMKVRIGKETYEAKFYVTLLGGLAVLGTSFMIDYAVKISLGKPPVCTIRGERVAMIESGGCSQKVCVLKETKVPPQKGVTVQVSVKNSARAASQDLFEPTTTLLRRHGVIAQDTLVDVGDAPFEIRVYNPSQHEVLLRPKTCVGILKESESVRPICAMVRLLPDKDDLALPPADERPGKCLGLEQMLALEPHPENEEEIDVPSRDRGAIGARRNTRKDSCKTGRDIGNRSDGN